ncbi:MAG: response regulator [Bacteroidia bacterium]|nr:response regulator [Bacteroidia bacterium]
MSKTRILVVEDESIVAKDIQKSLEKLGYEVPATASSAAAAYEKLEEIQPDLVFLDIKLKGEEDGIHIAGHIREKYNIPVIFLTSYVDQETLDRAKVTEPYGYIVKPFNESDLKTTVEMALFKFSKDREVRDSQQRLANALAKVEESIIVVDTEGRVSYLNEKAENLLGYSTTSAIGMDAFQLFVLEEEGGVAVKKDELLAKMRKDEPWENHDCFLLVKRDNSSLNISASASPIHDEKNQYLGCAIVISDKQTAAGKTTAEAPVQAAFLDNQIIQNSFFVKKGSMLVKVYLDNILWIQAMDNYVIIQTTADQFVIHSTMKDIEVKLPQSKFLRVHRSYIIPIDKINVLDENTVLIGDKTIPIGKSYKDTFMARLNFL